VVARADHRRIDEPVLSLGGQQQFGVAQFDLHLVAGADVGHVHLEHVGPVLVEQGGGLAFLLRGLELDARALLLADGGVEHAVPQAHRHRVDRRLRRAGEDVAGLDRALAFVAVDLGHAHVGDRADDARVDLRALERQAVDAGIVAGDVEVRAFGAGGLGVVGMGGRPGHQQQGCEQRRGDSQDDAADAAGRAQQRCLGRFGGGHQASSLREPPRWVAWLQGCRQCVNALGTA
jgi:hypothetical protein